MERHCVRARNFGLLLKRPGQVSAGSRDPPLFQIQNASAGNTETRAGMGPGQNGFFTGSDSSGKNGMFFLAYSPRKGTGYNISNYVFMRIGL